MKMKYCLTCIFLCVTISINAQDSSLFILANAKQQAKNYIEASVLYERILFNTSDEQVAYKAIMGKIQCLKQAHDFVKAKLYIKANINLLTKDSFKTNLFQEWVTCTYLSNDLEETLSLIEQAKTNYPNADNNWLSFIKILSLNEQNKWNDARIEYKAWLVKNKLDSNEVNIYQYKPRLKSESRAQWLSTVIPGGGQFYVGKPWEGLMAVLIQASCVWYGVASFENKYYLSAWFIGGGLFGSFHQGSVRRVEELARQYNKRKSSAFNTVLRNQIITDFQKSLSL